MPGRHEGTSLTGAEALDRLDALYQQSVGALRTALRDFVENGTVPDAAARAAGAFADPDMRLSWGGAAALTADPDAVLLPGDPRRPVQSGAH
ncbi:hypothetical protein [Nocardia brasiliensis]|uniref:hypothetical protein n=1 Tax=Nocardia brasiliensis TaxID=37326 RepID=UPI00245472E3|nr:hypothetical protein [Nocardia brasiliensis]